VTFSLGDAPLAMRVGWLVLLLPLVSCANNPTWDSDNRSISERQVAFTTATLQATVPSGWETHNRLHCFNRPCFGTSPLRRSDNRYSPWAFLAASTKSRLAPDATPDSYSETLIRAHGERAVVVSPPTRTHVGSHQGLEFTLIIQVGLDVIGEEPTGLSRLEARRHFVFELDDYLIDCYIETSQLISGQLLDAHRSFCGSIERATPPNQPLHPTTSGGLTAAVVAGERRRYTAE